MKTPYQILVWLCLLWSQPSFAKLPPYEELVRQLNTSELSGCVAVEAWGASIFLLDGEHGISHYIQLSETAQDKRQHYQQVRFIATDKGVTECAVVGDALVFVDPAHGVYQTDRSIESDGEQLWLAAIPVHYSDKSRFEMVDDELFLVTGRMRDQVIVDVAVRNDDVPVLLASEQLDAPITTQTMGAPRQAGAETMAITVGDSSFLLNLNSFEFEALKAVSANSAMIEFDDRQTVVSLLPDVLSIRHSSQGKGPIDLGLVRDADAQGMCLGKATLVSFDRDGQLRRYELSHSAVALEGEFQLSREVLSCLVDSVQQRLLVVEKEVGIWVFDLSETGLSMPRAVTTDKMIESLTGLALYEQGERGFVVTQSIGDGTFLVFDRISMKLVGQFRIAANLALGIDGVRASRGFAATSLASAKYPAGVLVVHDQRNRMPEAGENLKLVDWRSIRQLLEQ